MVATAKKLATVDTSTWLTRRQASDLLGVSEATLANHERRGLLHSQRAYRGDKLYEYIVYDPDELARLPRRKSAAQLENAPGELCARAFEMFERGRSICDVVIELRETQPKVAELHEQWLDSGAGNRVINRDAMTELAQILGPFATVADLIERVRDRFVTIEAAVPEGVNDRQVERAIERALDTAGAPR